MHIWETQGLVRRLYGCLTADELAQSAAIVQADPRFDEMRYIINDCRDCDGVSVSSDAIEEIAAIDGAAARVNNKIRIATVSVDPEVLAITDMYESADYVPFVCQNFSTMDEAREWLSEKY